MKRLSKSIISFLAMIIFSLSSLVNAVADDKTCFIKSDVSRVYLTVWDEDSDGDRQDKIFEGWLESGKRQAIKSTTGYINYSYKLADDDRSYGGENRSCEGDNTIRVP